MATGSDSRHKGFRDVRRNGPVSVKEQEDCSTVTVLQRVLNTATQLVFSVMLSEHITPLLCDLLVAGSGVNRVPSVHHDIPRSEWYVVISPSHTADIQGHCRILMTESLYSVYI